MMCRYVSLLLLVLLSPRKTFQRSHYDSPSYVAAVVEYSPAAYSANGTGDAADINAKNYVKIIDKAASYGADIIVFPESSLAVVPKPNTMARRAEPASYIPDPGDNIIPCTDESKPYKNSLKSISCAARDYKMYILLNHREKVDCTVGEMGCARDGFLIYNSNVAFDRDGRVIAKYRKYHLFHELGVNNTSPVPTTFSTDFGVTFGTFTCFDLIYSSPALNLSRDLGITDILYPTHWFDTPPFLFATEIQAAWAYGHDVNFMASGHNNPDTLSGGSGIYMGKQGYVDVISKRERSNVLLVAEVPKIINGTRTGNIDRSKAHVHEFTKEEMDTSKTEKNPDEQQDEQIDVESVENVIAYLAEGYAIVSIILGFTSKLIDLTIKRQEKTVCNRGLCCNFKLTIDFDESSITNQSIYYRYHLAAINKTDSASGIKSCAILACTNVNQSSCGVIFPDKRNFVSPVTFTSLEISTPLISNTNKKTTNALPATYTQDRIPMNATDFAFTSIDFGENSKYRMELKKPADNLLTFAIFHSNLEGEKSLLTVATDTGPGKS